MNGFYHLNKEHWSISGYIREKIDEVSGQRKLEVEISVHGAIASQIRGLCNLFIVFELESHSPSGTLY